MSEPMTSPEVVHQHGSLIVVCRRPHPQETFARISGRRGGNVGGAAGIRSLRWADPTKGSCGLTRIFLRPQGIGPNRRFSNSTHCTINDGQLYPPSGSYYNNGLGRGRVKTATFDDRRFARRAKKLGRHWRLGQVADFGCRLPPAARRPQPHGRPACAACRRR
jgi:hypothetical protein